MDHHPEPKTAYCDCICQLLAGGILSKTAGEHAVQRYHHAADDVEIPAQQVDAGESEIFRPDHHGYEEIAEHRGNGRNEEEENHDHAMHGEEFVVGVGLDEIARGREQLEADEQREEASDEKEERDGKEIEKRDAFVVSGKPYDVSGKNVSVRGSTRLRGAVLCWCKQD